MSSSSSTHHPPSLFSSARLFGKEIVHLWYFWVVIPFKVYDVTIEPRLPEHWRIFEQLPSGLTTFALVVAFICASIGAYHKLHKAKWERERELAAELTAVTTDPARKLAFVHRTLRQCMSIIMRVKKGTWTATAEEIFECRKRMATFVASALDEERAADLCQPYHSPDSLKASEIGNFVSLTRRALERMATEITEADIAQGFEMAKWENWDPTKREGL